jgi:hypothetical protein
VVWRRAASCRQLIEQGLSLLQIERVEALGEPAVDRREQIAGLIPLALITPQPRHAPYVPVVRGRRVADRVGDIDYIGQLEDDLADFVAVVPAEKPISDKLASG